MGLSVRWGDQSFAVEYTKSHGPRLNTRITAKEFPAWRGRKEPKNS